MSNERFTEEQIKKAKAAKTPEELLKMAEENGIELTLEQAKGYYAMLNPTSGALSDEELENVAGGGCVENEREYIKETGHTLMWVHWK